MPWMRSRVHPSLGGPRLTAKDADDFMIGRIVDAIAELMAKYGVEKEPLGIDGSTLQMLFAEAFGKKGIEVVHGKPTMDEARLIKTQDEIELMRITCANSEKAFAAIADAIRPGVRECDLVGIGIKALYEEGDDHTEDLVCCSGYNTNPYGWSFTDKPIRPGDLIYIDVDGASYQGYKSCVYRTFCCGKATSGAEGSLRGVPRHALRGDGRGEGRSHRLRRRRASGPTRRATGGTRAGPRSPPTRSATASGSPFTTGP